MLEDILAEVMQQASSIIIKTWAVLKAFYSNQTQIFLLECLYFSILQDLKNHIFETES